MDSDVEGGVVDGSLVEGGAVMVMVDGRECAISEEGLRGYLVLKGPKPVMSTLISAEDSAACEEESWWGWGGITAVPDSHKCSWVETERRRQLKVSKRTDGGRIFQGTRCSPFLI